MLITLKNAALVDKEFVLIPFSNLKMAILKILANKGYVKSFEIDKKTKQIKVVLRYSENMKYFEYVKRISKPGQRIYIKSSAIPYPKTHFGIIIISTPKGMMTGYEAKKLGLGGELICEVA